MKLMAPDYYASFRCIADQCRHSCCIGWEIDIDEDSLARYHSLPGPLGERLRERIEESAEGAHFRLDKQERCPFLLANGLCEMICVASEDMLCQICADHPRFRSFFSDRTEIGLGLCCEEAARLILTRESPMTLVTLEDDGEEDELWEEDEAVLALRDELLTLAQDRSQPILARAEAIEARCAGDASSLADWAAFLLTLERLDPAWTDRLTSLQSASAVTDMAASCWDTALEQLLCYLLFRHLPGALEDGMLRERALMCTLLWRVARDMTARMANASLADFCEIARMLSSEIEYSDENIGAILDRLAQT